MILLSIVISIVSLFFGEEFKALNRNTKIKLTLLILVFAALVYSSNQEPTDNPQPPTIPMEQLEQKKRA